MKIDINHIKQIPKDINSSFGVCVYGHPDKKIDDWIEYHNFKTEVVGPYTNIFIDKELSEIFNKPFTFSYLDGFSPNLNKHLHLGHLSNLVLAKAFFSLGVAKNTIAILGDTISGEVEKDKALKNFNWYCNVFDYKVDKLFFASDMKVDDSCLVDGTGEYENTKVFIVEGNQIVGIKSNGSTTYFYQDVSLAKTLSAPTLYLTGGEQDEHFCNLQCLFPSVKHINLGLVKAGKKMSSRLGNVIMAEQVMDTILEKFNGNIKLAYNILAGYILKSAPISDKKINLSELDNPLNSKGLYLSYTLAKLKSCDVVIKDIDNFSSKELEFKLMKSQALLYPNILFDALVEYANDISKLYETLRIKDNEENKIKFGILGSDLLFGMKKLGMFDVDKV